MFPSIGDDNRLFLALGMGCKEVPPPTMEEIGEIIVEEDVNILEALRFTACQCLLPVPSI